MYRREVGTPTPAPYASRLRMFVRPGLVVSLVVGLLGFAGCAATEERPRTEDDARRLAPLPACFTQLGPSRRSGPKEERAAVSLREEQIWPLVFPSFDPKRGVLDESARACTGRFPLRDEALKGGTPAKVEEGNIVMGGGGDRLKSAWMRSETFEDGTAGGALALLRGLEGTAEVYAVGSYRGRPKTMFTIERLGPIVVVVAQDDGCKARKPTDGCESTVSVFQPRFGVLDRVATIAQERVTFGVDSEPGVHGKVEYRLASSIQYLDGGIRVLEQVLVRDELARELRRSEQERSFTFAPDGSLIVDEDSLWSRIAAKPPTKTKEKRAPD